MITIRRGTTGRIAILCEDIPGDVPRQRLVEAWGKVGIDIYPLAATSLEYIEGDFVCCGRFGTPRWNILSQLLGLAALDNQNVPPGTYLIEKATFKEQDILLALGQDLAGLLYALEDLSLRGVFSPEGLTYQDDPQLKRPALAYRLLWTWDHSTNWNLSYEGQLDWGCANAYLKPAEAFVDDYKRLIDWSSRHHLNGFILWGFLRDAHDGVGAAQEICRYARERGVRVLPGVGTSFYGGFYYQGDHVFSAEVWLRRHPEYAALDRTGKPTPRLCPSEPANQTWLREGTHWLFETFDIDGVNLESGDFMVCYCNRCQALRHKMRGDDPDFFKEMCISLRPVIEEILTIRDDAWITYGTYTGFNPAPLPRDMGQPDPAVVQNLANMGSPEPILVRELPPQVITQWSLTAMLNQEPTPLLDFLEEGQPASMLAAPDWPKGLRPPGRRNIGMFHQGSQWYNRGDKHTRYSLEIATIKEACLRSVEAGLEGLAITGEASPMYTPCELNYLALAHFSFQPADSLQAFAESSLAPLIGGPEFALSYVNFLAKREADLMTAADETHLAEIMAHFTSAAEKGADWHTYRRWRWLSTYRTSQICDGTGAVLSI
jgi:hypothetical protein